MTRDTENRFNTYRYRGGTFRFGADGQIVDVETHLTICNSNDATEWIKANAHKQDGANRKVGAESKQVKEF